MKDTKKELLEKINRLESRIADYQKAEKEKWNKYTFKDYLSEEIESKIESGEINDEEEFRQFIDETIDNECIYYKTCWEIAMELNATDFTDFGIEINTLSHLAYHALQEYVNEVLDMDEFNNLILNRESDEK